MKGEGGGQFWRRRNEWMSALYCKYNVCTHLSVSSSSISAKQNFVCVCAFEKKNKRVLRTKGSFWQRQRQEIFTQTENIFSPTYFKPFRARTIRPFSKRKVEKSFFFFVWNILPLKSLFCNLQKKFHTARTKYIISIVGNNQSSLWETKKEIF